METTGRGRPRGRDYEKNLAKRQRLAQVGEVTQKENRINERLLHLAKSFYNNINTPELAGRYGQGKTPVYTDDQMNFIRDGVQLRPSWRIPTDYLRNASYGTSLISTIHTFRIEHLMPYFRIDKKKGLWFRMEDEDEEITPEVAEKMKRCGNFFAKMGDLTPGWQNRDHLFPVFEMMVRDTLTIDAIAFFLIYNSLGKLIEIRYLDPATIFPVDSSKGYNGDKSVAFVQIVQGNVVETFGAHEILWCHKNHLSDVLMRGFGFSPLEACMLDLIGVINSLKYNRDRFTRQPPSGFLSVQGDLGEETMEALQLQWQEMVSGLDDSHRIPIIGTSAGEVRWTPLNLTNDIVFEKLMQWCVSLVLMGHGMDQSEVGLRLIGSQATYEGNQNEKAKTSMTRAGLSQLNYFESVCTRIKDFRDDFAGIVCGFKGTDPEDEKEKVNKLKDEISNWKMVDEVRVSQDLPTVGEALASLYGVSVDEYKMAGGVILNPTFQQNFGQIMQSQATSAPARPMEYDPTLDASHEEIDPDSMPDELGEPVERDEDLVL